MFKQILFPIIILLLSSCQYFTLKDQIKWADENNIEISFPKLYNYPQNGTAAGDTIPRGFYITSYPGVTLSKVTLWLSAISGNTGNYSIVLTAYEEVYDGPIVGTASSYVFLNAYPSSIPVVFDFSNIPMIIGSTIAFKLTVDTGPITTFNYDTNGNYAGLTGSSIGIVQTNGTTPPLDTFRRDGIAIILEGEK